ncbi:CHAT domain-containing protein [Actinoplanes sp. NPDC051411]|uniref:CHAT domain-containing protein n=1 Tax=Actinoplanes sp. NPDC051411 TaxID=3155522 RepID=UPI00342F4688
MSLALVLAEAGRPDRALREIDAAAPALQGLPAARLTMQRALILDRLSRFDEAMAGYTSAIADFRRFGDSLWEARALTNRGVLYTYRGHVRQAESDLLAAEHRYAELGQDAALAQVRHNLGFARARAGDLPAALRWYERADEYFARTSRPAVALMDRAELLLDARLLPEARATAGAALKAAKASRMGLFEAQAQLMVAEAALAAGDVTAARAAAATARRAFARQQRPAWSALARYVELRAGGGPEDTRLRRAREVAAALATAGWAAPALDARLHAARLALARAAAEPAHATRLLRAASADLHAVEAAGRRGPAHLRARAWHAKALLREATGDTAGARRALLAGMTVLRRYSAALGATELRTLTGGYATDLATAGLRLAVRGGRPRSILWWAERWRATALRRRPTRPPDESALAADLAQLRRVHAEAESATTGLPALLREQRLLEERIRRRSWQAADASAASRETGDSLRRLPDRLGDATLVELLDIDDIRYAVVVSAAGFRCRRLGPVSELGRELEALRFALRRIVHRHGTAVSRAAAREAARSALRHLDDFLFGPLRLRLGAGPLIVVPVGELHATPWALLPTCRGRPVTIAPSASSWLAAGESATGRPAPGPDKPPVLVAGPGLRHADEEIRRLAPAIPAAATLIAAEATVDAVSAALDGAPLAHVAAHGTFRADNPMFSYLHLADGPLTVFDLERLPRPPRTVVLSACNGGLSAVHPGEELMGLTAALLGLGTRTVLASVLPAQDAATAELMIAVHRRLAAGDGPAQALAQAQIAAGTGLDEDTVSAAAFSCFGVGSAAA